MWGIIWGFVVRYGAGVALVGLLGLITVKFTQPTNTETTTVESGARQVNYNITPELPRWSCASLKVVIQRETNASK